MFSWRNIDKDKLDKISKIRDVVLVNAIFIYISGYLIWSYSAWKNNIGLLPALDFQYVMAGWVPLFIILMVYAGLRIIKWIYSKLKFNEIKLRAATPP
jgi:hypothetical protein